MEQEAFFQYTPATMPNDYQADRYVWSDIVPSGFPTSHSMMAPYAAAPLDIPYFRSQVHGPYDRYGRPTDPMAMPWPDLPQPLPPMAPPIPEQHTEGHQRQRQTTLPDPARKKTISYIKPSNGDDVVFHTPVDVMMRALQKKDDVASSSSKAGAYSVKSEPSTPQAPSTCSQDVTYDEKKYRCPYEGCSKSFRQSTHLETHKRAHNGEKPYKCEWPGCGGQFSQPGNLKTHTRLHTGERPFQCEECGTRFAQRGNLAAHKATHSKIKPFVCKLDDCNKCFTTRGNLKNHQNKYHKQTITTIADWITSLTDVNALSHTDRELLSYFENIYKNSNKGIKGRGRDRQVSEVRGKTKKLPRKLLPSLGI
ncbi:hypothetical protein ACHAO3_008572 [Verticillium nonalfalfae]|uniref:C2H2-type domain-containing protein n=1 Tax=Verticillium dahliae TaxID=27337 RepID=A0A444RJA7_VERDA|nr:hypothetical protein VD0001_g5345 [Verticillium dahliae]RXG41207.1 hypothetical protein VDGE_30520 [Verticillium dahliae]